MKEPTFYNSNKDGIDITWAKKDKRLCIGIDDETGIYVFGVGKSVEGPDIIEFDITDFLNAYKWFEEEA